MPSLIPGFEYDIFISYRQKDNSYDGWVTVFVDNLRKELESTFKEDISVYFDINPHDGLLQTHDVNASLAEKLKCLIFIPVISRTYCDNRSFAWEHEFKAFIDYASADRFGIKVRLTNGNVGSRVLPVRIYDLDTDDIRLCEAMLGGPIRGIDFVYREPGINRPLTQDDDEKKNLERTKYRNQINKTGNAIKEIISGLRSDPPPADRSVFPVSESAAERPEPVKQPSPVKRLPSFLTSGSLRILLVCLLLIVVSASVLLLVNRNPSGKTIAILFSTDIKSDSSLQYVGDVYAETIHSKIKAVKRIAVRPRINLLQYRDSDKPLNTIRKELAVDYLLYGNIIRNIHDITISVTLISEGDNKELWSNQYHWDMGRISVNSSEIVRTIATYMHAGLSADERNRIETDLSVSAAANINYAYANFMSYTAWSSYSMGNKLLSSVSFASAISTYDKAIGNDPGFAEAYAKRAVTRAWGYYTGQLDSSQIQKCRDDIDKAFDLNKTLPEAQIASGFYYYYCKVDYNMALDYFGRAAKQNPDDYQPLFYMAMVYRRMGEWEKSMEILHKVIRLNPQEALEQTNIGISYAFLHNYDSALIFYQKAIDLMPGWPDAWANKIEAVILRNGDISKARDIMNDAIRSAGDDFSEFRIRFLMYERKFHEALAEAEHSPSSGFGIGANRSLYLAITNKYLGKDAQAAIYFDSSLVSFRKDLKRDPLNSLHHSLEGIVYAATGNKEKAIAEAEKVRELLNNNIHNESRDLVNLAKIYTLTGEYDQAFSTLEYLLRTPSIFSGQLLRLDPVWDPLRDHADYKKLMAKYTSE